MSDADAVKKMRGVLKEAKSGMTTFTPEELTPVAEAIKAAPKEGMAMGLAMKALASQPVDSDDVKIAIAALRQ